VQQSLVGPSLSKVVGWIVCRYFTRPYILDFYLAIILECNIYVLTTPVTFLISKTLLYFLLKICMMSSRVLTDSLIPNKFHGGREYYKIYLTIKCSRQVQFIICIHSVSTPIYLIQVSFWLEIKGDVKFAEVLEKMGAKVTWTKNSVTVTGPPRDSSGQKHLRAVDVNMNKMPDVAMTLAVVALFADGPTAIRDGMV